MGNSSGTPAGKIPRHLQGVAPNVVDKPVYDAAIRKRKLITAIVIAVLGAALAGCVIATLVCHSKLVTADGAVQKFIKAHSTGRDVFGKHMFPTVELHAKYLDLLKARDLFALPYAGSHTGFCLCVAGAIAAAAVGYDSIRDYKEKHSYAASSNKLGHDGNHQGTAGVNTTGDNSL